MGVASGCGEQEVGVASGSGWNLWVWLLGVVLRRYIDFLILLIPTPLVSVLFCSSIPTFLFIIYILRGFCTAAQARPKYLIKWVELARNRNKWLGRTRHPYIRAVHARYHARTCAQIRKRCGIVT